MFPIPEIGYGWILVLLASMAFFVKAAEMEGRSRLVGGGLSLVFWLVFTGWIVGGIAGGLLSQLVLFLALTSWSLLRERIRNTPGA